jgi:beta-1,4-mannosyltransferase
LNKPFVVLQSFPVPRPTTNPYLVMLGRSLSDIDGVEIHNFSWRTALATRYDVFHVHWPEILVSGHSPLKKIVRQVLFVLLLVKLRLTRTPLVRTVHNLELPQGISRREVFLLKIAERQTTLRIKINTSTELPAGQPFEVIPHGDYSAWYGRYRQPGTIPGRVSFFGMIRRYKGVDGLVRAFRETEAQGADLTLRIAGRPSTEDLGAELRELAGGDPRISMSLEFLTEEQLVSEIGEAELVVLPYPEMHNSGGALTALSLGRPVLMSDNAVNRLLGEEVGSGWVFCYAGRLTGDAIARTLSELRAGPSRPKPDLSSRDWGRAGRDHLAAYRRAVGLRRGRK